MRLTEIPDVILNRTIVPNSIRHHLSRISDLDSRLLEYVQVHGARTARDKSNVIRKMNSMAYQIIIGDYIDVDPSTSSGFDSIVTIEDSECQSKLGSLFIKISDVDWDIDTAPDDKTAVSTTSTVDPAEVAVAKPQGFRPLFETSRNEEPPSDYDVTTYTDSASKASVDSDISFAFKKVPKFDPDRIWAVGHDVYGRQVPIYMTLPEIPRVQNDVTVTTDINKMSRQDLLNLFPDRRLRPRHAELYEKIDGFDWDPILGYIPKILDFTKDQIIENLIKYPKFSLLFRTVGEQRVSFTNFIELDGGNIVPWNVAAEISPDMVALPKSKIFYRDYIVRRYLLERDVLHIQHKYPLIGTFDPFMTLFTTMDEYKKLGYTDFESMARQCVVGRVKFFQTRNPLVRGLLDDESRNS